MTGLKTSYIALVEGKNADEGALCGESAAVVIGEADPGRRFGAISLLRRAKGGLRRHFGAKTLLIEIREALTIEKRLRSD